VHPGDHASPGQFGGSEGRRGLLTMKLPTRGGCSSEERGQTCMTDHDTIRTRSVR
jgi:hypothetical protein